MNFRIVADMGISLVKGILISFVSVMVFFPALLLCGNKLIEKTRNAAKSAYAKPREFDWRSTKA